MAAAVAGADGVDLQPARSTKLKADNLEGITKVAAFTEFGGPDVLRVLELPEPHAGPGGSRPGWP
jgi:hypothetical protein